MTRPVIFDITRLLTRLTRATPNGIDRVDLAYARHYLSADRGEAWGGLMGYRGIPRLVGLKTARAVAEGISAGWREDAADTAGSVGNACEELRRALKRQASPTPNAARAPGLAAHLEGRLSRLRTSLARFRKVGGDVIGSSALFPGQDLVRHAPRGAIFLNVSQFPIWREGYFRWLEARPDIRPVFFLHDLLPLQYPEFFRPFEVARHRGRLRTITRTAAGVIVASDETRKAFLSAMAGQARPVPPVLVAPLPVARQFQTLAATSPGQSQSPQTWAPPGFGPFFVSIGTLEPRKNQLFLLQLWRELRALMGEDTPRLLLIGARGWENENILDMLQRSPSLNGFVFELHGLSTEAVALLLKDCAALLMPTFAEGFGLPVAEALAAGAHVIASDIPVFQSYPHSNLKLNDPLDGPKWIQSIRDASQGQRSNAEPERPASETFSHLYQFGHIDKFLDHLI